MLNQDSIHSPLELHAEFDLLCLNLRIPRKMVQCGGSCVHVMLFMSVSWFSDWVCDTEWEWMIYERTQTYLSCKTMFSAKSVFWDAPSMSTLSKCGAHCRRPQSAFISPSRSTLKRKFPVPKERTATFVEFSAWKWWHTLENATSDGLCANRPPVFQFWFDLKKQRERERERRERGRNTPSA